MWVRSICVSDQKVVGAPLPRMKCTICTCLPVPQWCRPQKISCKIGGKCCKSGVKWAKVGLASWKGPLSASALPPCQLLSQPLLPPAAKPPHTLFNFQIGINFKEVCRKNCKFCVLDIQIHPQSNQKWMKVGREFWILFLERSGSCRFYSIFNPGLLSELNIALVL